MAVEMLNRLVAFARRVLPDRGDILPGFWMARRRLPVPVTPNTALTISTVWRCIDFIAGNIMQLPWGVMQKTGDGKGSQDRSDHPAYWLLDRRPNAEMTAVTWRQMAMLHVLIYGNFFAEIERDLANRPLNLWPIDPRRITIDREDETGRLIYRVSNTSGEAILYPEQVFHVPGMSFDGVCGLPVIEYAARTFGLTMAAEEYGTSFFGNSGVPSTWISHPKTLSTNAQKRLRAHVDNRKGVYASQDTLVLEEGAELHVLGLPPEQAQFLETRRFTVEDVCRWFGVPPSKVGHFEKISYNSAEQLSMDVIKECLLPWARKFEQEADFKLLGNNYGRLYSKLDFRGLMRATHTERSKYYKDLFSIGAFSIDEIRALEDSNPIGEGGDLHFVPLNMADVEKVASGELLPNKQPTEKTNQPQTQEPNPQTPPSNALSEAAERRNRRLMEVLDETLLMIEQDRSPEIASDERTYLQ
jgi:HK97 family phage portal protein